MHKKENVKNVWNDVAEPWAEFVREGKDHYRDGLNNPATLEIIGDVRSQVILDIACGEGYNTRILAKKGAKVVGVDFSEKLVQLAIKEEEKEKLGIRYYVLDASNLGEFSDGSFDLVTCFMALQDIEEYERAIGEVARVLRKRGRFVFSIPHPCFETLTVKGRRIRASEMYFETGSYPIHWDMKRLSNHFVTIAFHRTLTDYFNALSKSRLFTARLVEPKPTEETLKKYPLLKDVKARPQSIIIESTKIHDL